MDKDMMITQKVTMYEDVSESKKESEECVRILRILPGVTRKARKPRGIRWNARERVRKLRGVPWERGFETLKVTSWSV